MKIFYSSKIILIFFLFLVSCKIQEVELKNINLKEVKSAEKNNILADVELKINNKNKFSILLKKVEIILKSDDKKAGSINLVKPIKVLPDEKTYNAQLRIEIENEFKSLKNILINVFTTKKGFSYEGDIVIKKFFVSKKIKITKTK